MDPNSIQQRMNQIQQDESFSGVLGKLLSGKSGYKPVIEKKYIQPICPNCQYKLDDTFKFCPECGTKVEKPVVAAH
jgi:predicted amidophosphoribosyltransferase